MSNKWIAGLMIVAALGVGVYFARGPVMAMLSDRPRLNVLKPDGAEQLVLIDAGQPISLDDVPDGWRHRIFSTTDPMSVDFVEKDGRPSIRLATNDSASILTRLVEIPLDNYANLSWNWFIETPVRSQLDERTSAGDDHPARLTLKFRTPDSKTHWVEIVWGNTLVKAGDWYTITEFYLFDAAHYVARGGMENVGRWHAESVDLRELLRHLGADPAGAALIEIGLFADTDGTHGSTVAYLSSITAHAK